MKGGCSFFLTTYIFGVIVVPVQSVLSYRLTGSAGSGRGGNPPWGGGKVRKGLSLPCKL